MIRPIALPEFRERIARLYRDLARRPSTIQKLDMVLRELEAAGVSTTADVTTESVARWRATACGGRSPETVAGLLSVIRAAVSFALAERMTDRAPNWRMLRPRIPIRDDDRHLPWESVVRLLAHLRDRARRPGERYDRRLHALVATFAYTGIRRDEGLFLRSADVDLDAGVVWLRDVPERPLKTVGSGLPVPMPPELAAILAPWIAEVGPSSWLFPGVRNPAMPWHGGGPGRRPIDALQAAAQEAGLGRRITWHVLRHSWATHAETLWGLSDAQIQRVLRHTKAATSSRYRHADVANLAALGRRVTFAPIPALASA